MGKENKFLMPAKGMMVRDPHTKAIMPAEGMVVPWIGPIGRYYRRRVNCGDCLIVEKQIKNKHKFFKKVEEKEE
jgi:hypothetical protein